MVQVCLVDPMSLPVSRAGVERLDQLLSGRLTGRLTGQLTGQLTGRLTGQLARRGWLGAVGWIW